MTENSREELRENSIAKNRKDQVTNTQSHARLRHFLVHLLGIGGTLLAIYVSGWVMFLEPLIAIYREYRAGTMTYGDILKVAISVAMAATAGGGIWCAFDILANFFRDRD
jgi:hypothetical protein